VKNKQYPAYSVGRSVILDGSEDMFVILHRTDLIGDLYSLFARAPVVALTSKLVDTLAPSPVLKGIVVL